MSDMIVWISSCSLKTESKKSPISLLLLKKRYFAVVDDES